MRRPVFDDLLDEHIASAPTPATRSWIPGPAGTATAYGFFFGSSPAAAVSVAVPEPATIARGFSIDAIGSEERRAAIQRPAPLASRNVGRTGLEAAPRRLSASQTAALEEMNALGANLSPSFTFGELRRAFRRLALRYHPDRHTSRSADERGQLSECFTRSRDAYRTLTAVFTPVH
jgi:hypothetical protein